jgi:hypothetical protein
MDAIDTFGQQLVHAAHRRRRRRGWGTGWGPRPRRRPLPRGRLRVALIVFVLAFATTAIALAATGVILSGSPVRPEGPLNPTAGEGVPASGAARLLPLRVPDPEGGLPWGMRIVQTTRGLICEQIGRVYDGQLGELGIDGVFHDDGRFHPLPTDVLPETSHVGARGSDEDATDDLSCQLEGQAVAGTHIGVDRSAGAANGYERTRPRSDLRDIYFGILGSDAVSVSYRAGATSASAPVLAPAGAYLIVRPSAPGQKAGYGDASLGTFGDLPASAPLTAITYRLHGKLCQRGPSLPPGGVSQLVHPCPQPRWPSARYAPPRNLHQPLHLQLRTSNHVLDSVQLSFNAPIAVVSARENYVVRIPNIPCQPSAIHAPVQGVPIAGGYGGTSLGRDVARGATVTLQLSSLSLFTGICGFPSATRHVSRRAATLEVLYQYANAERPPLLVGTVTVTQPFGTRLPAVPFARGPRGRR